MGQGKHFPKGLDHRMRDEDGEIRRKRADTKVGTIEREYGVDLGVRSDMLLGNYLAQSGLDSLSDALRNKKK